MAATVKLNAPWHTLREQLAKIFEPDKEVCVSKYDNGKISIVTENQKKGEAITTVIESAYNFGGQEVNIIVTNEKGIGYQGLPCETAEDVADILQKAFEGNCLMKGVEIATILPGSDKPIVFPIVAAQIVQFYNNDLSDYYQNYNDTLQNTMSQVLKQEMNHIFIYYSTEKIQ